MMREFGRVHNENVVRCVAVRVKRQRDATRDAASVNHPVCIARIILVRACMKTCLLYARKGAGVCWKLLPCRQARVQVRNVHIHPLSPDIQRPLTRDARRAQREPGPGVHAVSRTRVTVNCGFFSATPTN